MDLREFTKGDWDAFSGCNSRKPKISEEDVMVDERPACVVVDGAEVNIYVCMNEDRDTTLYARTFENNVVAEAMVSMMNTFLLSSQLVLAGFVSTDL